MDRIYRTPTPSVSLCIATYGAPAHIHLQLESHRRLYPQIPVMVHEDCSEKADAVREVCALYNVPFLCTPTRQGHQEGDLTAIKRGIEFGHQQGTDLVVKISRTYIPITNFVPALQQLAYDTQYAAFSNVCRSCDFGYRTECAAWHVPSYIEGAAMKMIDEGLERRSGWFDFVEAYMHKVVRRVCLEKACDVNREVIIHENREYGEDSFGRWEWMCINCRERNPGMLWHRSDNPVDYYRLSLIYDLPYAYESFVIQHY